MYLICFHIKLDGYYLIPHIPLQCSIGSLKSSIRLKDERVMAGKSNKTLPPQVLTANELFDGDVVYWRKDGAWVRDLQEAFIFEAGAGIEAALLRAEADVEASKILDPYMFAVSIDEGVVHPSSVRETIRAKGPTVRLDLGKQAA